MEIFGLIAKSICQFIDVSSIAIFGLAVLIEIYLLVKSRSILHGVKRDVKELRGYNITVGRKINKSEKHVVEKEISGTKKIDYEKMNEVRVEYQRAEKYYARYQQMIPLFTMLGILGTVAGLYLGVSNGEEIQEMFRGLGIALSTTVFGIFLAIAFKVVDIALLNGVVIEVDSQMELVEKDYNEYKVEGE